MVTWSVYSFIRDISIAPLQVHYYSEALPTKALILLTHWSDTGNCEGSTCPRSLHGSWSEIRTYDPPGRKAYHWATTPLYHARQWIIEYPIACLFYMIFEILGFSSDLLVINAFLVAYHSNCLFWLNCDQESSTVADLFREVARSYELKLDPIKDLRIIFVGNYSTLSPWNTFNIAKHKSLLCHSSQLMQNNVATK